jgi:hypothetical protein
MSAAPELDLAGHAVLAGLAALAERVGTLVAQARYGEAQAGFEAYCRDLQEALGGLPPGDPRRRRMAADGGRFLAGIRRRVLEGRAHAGTRLARLPKRLPPYGDAGPPRPSWDYSG